MTALTWCLGIGGIVILSVATSMAQREIESRIDAFPVAILRLARRTLPASHRDTLYVEWAAELDEQLHRAEGRPYTRLRKGVLYAAGLVRRGRLVAREMGDPSLARPDTARSEEFGSEGAATPPYAVMQVKQWRPADVQRIDSIRRTFTGRRFGTGYDAIQVHRLFDAIIASLSGRSAAVNEHELDPNQFSLVRGGYFEAEVNQALREVRALVRSAPDAVFDLSAKRQAP